MFLSGRLVIAEIVQESCECLNEREYACKAKCPDYTPHILVSQSSTHRKQVAHSNGSTALAFQYRQSAYQSPLLRHAFAKKFSAFFPFPRAATVATTLLKRASRSAVEKSQLIRTALSPLMNWTFELPNLSQSQLQLQSQFRHRRKRLVCAKRLYASFLSRRVATAVTTRRELVSRSVVAQNRCIKIAVFLTSRLVPQSLYPSRSPYRSHRQILVYAKTLYASSHGRRAVIAAMMPTRHVTRNAVV
ncbi:unnamed protein product [Alternaria alternata]